MLLWQCQNCMYGRSRRYWWQRREGKLFQCSSVFHKKKLYYSSRVLRSVVQARVVSYWLLRIKKKKKLYYGTENSISVPCSTVLGIGDIDCRRVLVYRFAPCHERRLTLSLCPLLENVEHWNKLRFSFSYQWLACSTTLEHVWNRFGTKNAWLAKSFVVALGTQGGR